MFDQSILQRLPTPDSPMLIGLLVDVSASMITNIRSSTGSTQRRLESFRDALEDFVQQGKVRCQDEASQQIIPLFKLFAYGFGFGNPLAIILGRKGPEVRDLLDRRGTSSSTIAIDQLFENWDAYQSHVVSMIPQMFGNTPMVEAFEMVKERFAKERESRSITDPPILFVLSDGEPNDGPSDQVLKVAQELKESGVFIVSCYVTDKDITHIRKLYSSPEPDWPDGAKLMFQCASVIPISSSFANYLREFGWEFGQDTHIFTQINQSEILKEFLQVILSPLQQQKAVPAATLNPSYPQLESRPQSKKIRVFVSYSHQDRKYLGNDSLLGYLKGLEQEDFEFWSDQRIVTSEIWDDEIKKQIMLADIALVLVSKAFLNSRYSREVEITAFLEEQKKRGLRIFPIILSACDWKRHIWLSSIQFQPRDDKNIERNFSDRGKRYQLFLEIEEDLRKIGTDIKQK